MNCPKCKAEIRTENINILTDVGQCLNCNHLFKISENLSHDIDDGFDINRPPTGAWIRKEFNQIVIGATTRSLIAFFLVPFMIVWSGGSLGGIYGGQIISGEFNPLISLFGLPFLLGSIIFWSIAFMAIWGKVELTLDNIGGKIFTGVGKIGLTQKFTWDEITTIKENQTGDSRRQRTEIQMEGKKRISFGSDVNESRRYYLLRALKSIINKVKSNKRII